MLISDETQLISEVFETIWGGYPRPVFCSDIGVSVQRHSDSLSLLANTTTEDIKHVLETPALLSEFLSILDGLRSSVSLLPIFILSTGQSNMMNYQPYSWEPSPNLLIWNNINNDVDSVGNAFVKPSCTSIIPSLACANKFALANPLRRVYVLNCARSGQPIYQWLPGASLDVYACIVANILPALEAAGVKTINRQLWWQGETWGHLSSYPADFEIVQTRFKSNSWFPVETPVSVFSVANEIDSGYSTFDAVNANLRTCVAASPSTRQFVDTTILRGPPFWDPTDRPHMTGFGSYTVGTMAANMVLGL